MADAAMTTRDGRGFGMLDRIVHRRIMEVLSDTEGERATLMELMLLLDSSKDTLRLRLRELEDAGLIFRKCPTDPHDHFFRELLSFDITNAGVTLLGSPHGSPGIPFEASRLIPLLG